MWPDAVSRIGMAGWLILGGTRRSRVFGTKTAEHNTARRQVCALPSLCEQHYEGECVACALVAGRESGQPVEQ